MINIEIKDLTGSKLSFEVSTDAGTESDSVLLDEETLKWVNSVLDERPFRSKSNESYSWYVIETEENSRNAEKKLTIEVHRGKSRVKRKSLAPKPVFLKFWNFLHHQKLPSQLESNVRSH